MTQYDPTEAAAGLVSFPMTTAFEFPEYQVQSTLGSCFGLVVRSMGAVRGIGASFKSIVGGEVAQYTKLLEDSRRHAMDRLVENARLMGANAIIGMRFDSSEIGNALTEIAAYGTAVVIGPRPTG
jgi:uncharacterized protein YbjQ (UPF0145 family)